MREGCVVAKKGFGNLEPWEINSVREFVLKSRRRRRSTSVAADEDLLQDCMLHWVRARQTLDFRALRDPTAFMARVLENKLRDLARQSHAIKRSEVSLDAIISSFDELIDECQPAELIEAVSPALGSISARFERADAAIDLSRVFGSLTRIQKALCYLIMVEDLSPNESGQVLCISRSTTSRELLRIRGIFLEFGLKNYFH